MKNLSIILLITATSAFASLSSPFPSTVDGITINNTHSVGSFNKVYRGQAPLGKIEQLSKFGITDILIFKNQTRNEIDREYAEISNKGLSHIQTKQIDFLWHKYPSYKESCEQLIDGLKLIRDVDRSKERKLFFHCTVGEDRTGALSGLWRMLSQKWSKKRAFYYEMCENGYGHGNGNKPFYVYNEIRTDLTPLFIHMANKVNSGDLSLENLNYKICTDDIQKESLEKLKCNVSSKFKSQQ
jgi:hypothetical protein